ncbi:MAG: HipA N-terminal domain-containing protein [Verrucomicrobia bacterium]|nr:HipA N-terminal domain-containing protein [Verrucomicrobiota bacterium]
MKRAKIYVDGTLAGYLIELEKNRSYEFVYLDKYHGPAISLTMPLKERVYRFDEFPPFFDGFLPEGFMLDALLRKAKLDKNDRFEQLLLVGQELVGNITVEKDDESMSHHV